MNDVFTYLVSKYGAPAKVESFGPGDGERWRGRLPPGLVEFWRECGIGQWVDGKLQFCRPELYASIVRTILGSDPDFKPVETYLFAFSAFGEILLWNETRQLLSVNLPFLWASAGSTQPGWTPAAPDNAIVAPLMALGNKERFDMHEDRPGTPLMFKRCLERYGRLEMGECYGLFPALALGGSAKIANVKRVKALEHFSFLAQLGPVRLANFEGGRVNFIRNLGSQS